MSGVTDPYQPVERRSAKSRAVVCEVLREVSQSGWRSSPKTDLVTRDIDLLGELAAHHAAAVNISITSLDPDLQRILEPRTSTPTRAAGGDRAIARRGNSRRRDDCADHSRPNGSRSSRDSESSGAKRARNLPDTRSCVCPGRLRRSSSVGSTNISLIGKRRSSVAFGICAAEKS